MQLIPSQVDESVNFVVTGDFPGAVEARYVRRSDDEVIVYLSSQTGCRKACRFCHLTQSGQTGGIDVTIDQYVDQAETVLRHYAALNGPRAAVCNFNFMARGEVFANEHVLTDGDRLIDRLADVAIGHGLLPRFKFSTIMPIELKGRQLSWLFPRHAPDIYYSLYSADERWRSRWMPKALPVTEGLRMLADYHRETRKLVVLHWALIEGENDSAQQVDAIIEAVRDVGLRADVNLVRYNPANPRLGREPSEAVLQARAQQLAAGLPGSRVQLVGRVGHDVKASCGMFISAPDARRPDGVINLPVLDSTASSFFRSTA